MRERLVGEQERVDLPVGLRAAPEQEIVSAGYDPRSKEGVVVLDQAGELVAQRIDPLGKGLGAPSRVGAARSVERRATLIRGSWMVPVNRGQSVLVLSGPQAGTEILAEAEEEPLRAMTRTRSLLVDSPGEPSLLNELETDPGSYDGQTLLLRGRLGKGGKKILLDESFPLPLGEGAMALEDGSLALFGRFEPAPDDPPFMNTMRRSWRTLIPPKGEPKTEDFEGDSRVLEVFHDHVLLHRPSPEEPWLATWLRSGKTIALDGSEKRTVDEFSPLHGGTLAFLSSPAPPVPSPPWKTTPGQCVDALPVGPRTRLLLCYQPSGAQGWRHTAGVRVLRF
ncbi:MAG: hypothetical protein MUF64_03785 [Polyangiaceae bacterium]|nr:hypothetical protein [Polyangiaceae bacterium]